jgi:hypothetical protein
MGLSPLAALPDLTDIPSARPSAQAPGATVPASLSSLAQPVSWLSGWGNSATATTPGASASPPSSASSSGLYGSLGTLAKWAAALVSSPTETTGLSLEDILFIVVGLVLIAAAFFTFHETQSVIKQATRTARGAADKITSKAAEAAAAAAA